MRDNYIKHMRNKHLIVITVEYDENPDDENAVTIVYEERINEAENIEKKIDEEKTDEIENSKEKIDEEIFIEEMHIKEINKIFKIL